MVWVGCSWSRGHSLGWGSAHSGGASWFRGHNGGLTVGGGSWFGWSARGPGVPVWMGVLMVKEHSWFRGHNWVHQKSWSGLGTHGPGVSVWVVGCSQWGSTPDSGATMGGAHSPWGHGLGHSLGGGAFLVQGSQWGDSHFRGSWCRWVHSWPRGHSLGGGAQSEGALLLGEHSWFMGHNGGLIAHRVMVWVGTLYLGVVYMASG